MEIPKIGLPKRCLVDILKISFFASLSFFFGFVGFVSGWNELVHQSSQSKQASAERGDHGSSSIGEDAGQWER